MKEFIRLPHFMSMRVRFVVIDAEFIQPIIDEIEKTENPADVCSFLEQFVKNYAIGPIPEDVEVCGFSSIYDRHGMAVRVVSKSFDRVAQFQQVPEWKLEIRAPSWSETHP